jgi:acetyl-CoA carboxylase biotin carboxyl carrier protein
LIAATGNGSGERAVAVEWLSEPFTGANHHGGMAMSVEVKAPMPGKILEVLVKVGDSVKEDDEIVMLEAMKMENPIYAPADGTVQEVKVKANDSVETEQVLVVIG